MPNQEQDEGWKNISTGSITKGFGGMHGFMRSYGIKPYDADAYEEANQIIGAMKQADWEGMSAAEKADAGAKYNKSQR